MAHTLDYTAAIRDLPLCEMDDADIQALSSKMKEFCGVSLRRAGSVYTLTHDDSGDYLQKPGTLTMLGAWRTASHIMRAKDESL